MYNECHSILFGKYGCFRSSEQIFLTTKSKMHLNGQNEYYSFRAFCQNKIYSPIFRWKINCIRDNLKLLFPTIYSANVKLAVLCEWIFSVSFPAKRHILFYYEEVKRNTNQTNKSKNRKVEKNTPKHKKNIKYVFLLMAYKNICISLMKLIPFIHI